MNTKELLQSEFILIYFSEVYPHGNLFHFENMIQSFFKLLARHLLIYVRFGSLIECDVRSTCSLKRKTLMQVMFLKAML